jgi:hypothetical protein
MMDAPPDTSADAYRAQIEAYRRMGGAGRVAVAFRLNALARAVAIAGIRSRHPEYDERQRQRAFARLMPRGGSSTPSRRPVPSRSI